MSLLYNRAIKIEDLDVEKNFKRSASYKKMMGNTSQNSHEAHIRLEQAKRLQAKVDENKKIALKQKKSKQQQGLGVQLRSPKLDDWTNKGKKYLHFNTFLGRLSKY